MFPLPMILPKVPVFEALITSNHQELDLAAWAMAKGWRSSTRARITVASGIFIWAGTTANTALVVAGFPKGLTLINNGFIIGCGGDGGSYGSPTGKDGGSAIALGQDVTIDTGTGYIAGGGGGGGGQTRDGDDGVKGGGGGGAGGGSGGSSNTNNGNYKSGGSPGSINTSGNDGGSFGTGYGGIGGSGGGSGGGFLYRNKATDYHGGGGGGGRILPSTTTTGAGGSGGGPEQGGGSAAGRGGGGGWGAVGGAGHAAGGAAGKAIELNGHSATIVGTQVLIYGPVA